MSGRCHCAFLVLLLALGVSVAGASERNALDAGDRLMAAKKYEDALTYWNRLLAESPDDRELLLRKGIAQSMLERLDDAEATLKTALAISPCDLKVLLNLGLLAQRRNRLGEAEVYFLKIAKDKPWYPLVFLGLGQIAELRGQHQKAMEFYVREINNSGNGNAWRQYFGLKARLSPPQPVPAFLTPLLVFLALASLVFLIAASARHPERPEGTVA